MQIVLVTLRVIQNWHKERPNSRRTHMALRNLLGSSLTRPSPPLCMPLIETFVDTCCRIYCSPVPFVDTNIFKGGASAVAGRVVHACLQQRGTRRRALFRSKRTANTRIRAPFTDHFKGITWLSEWAGYRKTMVSQDLRSTLL